MVLWFRYYLRRYLRPWMKEIDAKKAQSTHKKLTLFYIFISWNVLGLSYYMYRQRDIDDSDFKDKSDAHYWVRTLNIQQPLIYNVSTSGVQKMEMTNEDYPLITPELGIEPASFDKVFV